MYLQIAFVSAFVTLLAIERILHAASFLLLQSVAVNDGPVVSIKKYAAVQLLGACMTLITTSVTTVVNTLVAAAMALLSYAVWALIVTALLSTLYVVQEYYPQVFVSSVLYWNSYLGPYLHGGLVVPLRIADILFSSVVPVYDLSVWLVSQVFTGPILSTVLGNVGTVEQLGLDIAGLVRNSFVSVYAYVPTVLWVCEEPVTDACYEVGPRTLDLITPMADLRRIAVRVSLILDSVCRGITGPADIALYPLLDINTAKGVHNVVNSVLFAVLQVPSITVQRCKHNRGKLHEVALCTPDFQPAINLLVQGVRDLGRMADNWLDVSSIIVQESIGISSRTDCETSLGNLAYANYSRELFQGAEAQLRVVGLTEDMYAVTDGTHAQYFYHGKSGGESVISPHAWPVPGAIDTSLGVAAVTYLLGNPGERDHSGEPSTAMLGCSCSDSAGAPPMRIFCHLSLYEIQSYSGPAETNSSFSLDKALSFEVVFQKRSTANYLTCSQAEISVQSARWPATRITTPFQKEIDQASRRFFCQSQGSCSTVDATIWVTPKCASDASFVQPACVQSFIDASCYPYCMAARRSGAGADGLVLYNAKDWEEKVHVMDRDCGVLSAIDKDPAALLLASGQEDGAQVHYQGQDAIPSAAAQGSLEIHVSAPSLANPAAQQPPYSVVRLSASSWDPNTATCSYKRGATTMVPAASHPTVLPSVERQQQQPYRAIRMPGQPFAFAGDLALTPVMDEQGNHYLSVDRLYGNEVGCSPLLLLLLLPVCIGTRAQLEDSLSLLLHSPPSAPATPPPSSQDTHESQRPKACSTDLARTQSGQQHLMHDSLAHLAAFHHAAAAAAPARSASLRNRGTSFRRACPACSWSTFHHSATQARGVLWRGTVEASRSPSSSSRRSETSAKPPAPSMGPRPMLSSPGPSSSQLLLLKLKLKLLMLLLLLPFLLPAPAREALSGSKCLAAACAMASLSVSSTRD